MNVKESKFRLKDLTKNGGIIEFSIVNGLIEIAAFTDYGKPIYRSRVSAGELREVLKTLDVIVKGGE